MICPQCGGEFVLGVAECPDCRVPLTTAGHPTEIDAEEWLTVAELTSPVEIGIQASLLRSAGIPVLTDQEHSLRNSWGMQLLSVTFPQAAHCKLKVPASRHQEARAILEAKPEPID